MSPVGPGTHPTPTAYDPGLPSAVDAEKTILGAVLIDNNVAPDVFSTLKPDDFSLDSNRSIGRAMRRLMEAGSAIDIVTVSNQLATTRQIESVGGVAYLASLTEGLPRRFAVDDYIKILRDKTLLRQTMLICSQAIDRAADQTEPAMEIHSELMSALEEIISRVDSRKSGPVANWIMDTAENLNREYAQKIVPAIPSGNDWFDARAGGYRMGRMTIVAARPKVGKSGFAQQSIAHNCGQGRKVVDFSIEMDRDERARNLVPYVVDVPNRIVNKAELQTPEQNHLINIGLGKIAEWPYVCFDGELDIDQVCWTMAREAKSGEQVLFVLDHFGLMTSGEKDIRKRYVENSSRLRRTIKKLPNCALLSLFQLNPVPREYQDKRPIPDDIKESKNPIEDCYAFVLLHRYVDQETLRMTRKANINLALVRGGGSPGSVDCDFDVRRLSFNAPAEFNMDDD